MNLTTYGNKITRLPEERKTATVDGIRGYASGNYFIGEGKALYNWYMPKYAGVDPETGVALYWKDVKDANGNVTGEEKPTSTLKLQSTFVVLPLLQYMEVSEQT